MYTPLYHKEWSYSVNISEGRDDRLARDLITCPCKDDKTKLGYMAQVKR